MNREPWEQLINHLRAELTAYGDLLSHFERQQRGLFRPQPGPILEFAQSMEGAIRSTDTARNAREEFVRDLARAEGQPADATLRQMIPLAPEVLQPMLDSFVREIDRLVHVVRRRSRQNHEIIARTYQLYRDVSHELLQGQKPTTYGSGGKLQSPTGSAFSVAG